MIFYAAVAHLVERHLAKVEVASSSLVGRSIWQQPRRSNRFCGVVLFFPKQVWKVAAVPAIIKVTSKIRQGRAQKGYTMLEELKQQVYEANMQLPRRGLVTYTWGNVSGIDREKGLFVIKPSGVEYDELTPAMLVVMDLSGNKVEGDLNPSSDTKTHLELYRAFPQLGGIVHTHSTHAVAFAQARRDLPAFGTTHADYFYGPVPCTRELTPEEIDEGYEKNTGKVIVETFKARGIDPLYVPGVLCASHGPFTWGKDAAQAVYHAVVLEEVARMAILTLTIDPGALPAPQHVLDKHFMRKHGPNAYYGQK